MDGVLAAIYRDNPTREPIENEHMGDFYMFATPNVGDLLLLDTYPDGIYDWRVKRVNHVLRWVKIGSRKEPAHYMHVYVEPGGETKPLKSGDYRLEFAKQQAQELNQ